MVRNRGLSVRPVDPSFSGSLFEFMQELDEKDREFFHPHGCTVEEIREICASKGEDHFCVVVDDDRVVAYGMLRGWDEGFDVPSTGIAVRRDSRGKGVALFLMAYLHDIARGKGATRVRARIHPENANSIDMCEAIGYRFAGTDRGQLLGFCDLTPGGGV